MTRHSPQIDRAQLDGEMKIVQGRWEAPDGDTAYRSTCVASSGTRDLLELAALPGEFRGCTPSQALDRLRPGGGSGCLCSSVDRDHKWSLVLETLRHALSLPCGTGEYTS